MKLLIANWKMFLGHQASASLAKQIAKIKTSHEIVVCPSFVSLIEVKKNFGQKIKLGAQNVSWQAKGALTGEVSASILAKVGCRYVIIGHSERRILANEGDLVIREKLKLAAAHGLIPILCVGETGRDKEEGKTRRVIKRQLAVLNGLVFKKLIVAYEPVWAIGSDRWPTTGEIVAVHKLIRQAAKPIAKKVVVIYGGSVDEKNFQEIFSIPEVDGVLVGRASTKISFWKNIF